MSCPSLLQHFTSMVPLGGLSRVALYYSSQGSSASAAPVYGACCTRSSMLVSGHRPVMYTVNEPCTGSGVCTHSPNGAESARLWTVQQHTVWPEERGVAARLVTSSSGRTSRPGDPRPNPQGAGTDRPCCLLSTACLKNQQHPTA